MIFKIGELSKRPLLQDSSRCCNDRVSLSGRATLPKNIEDPCQKNRLRVKAKYNDFENKDGIVDRVSRYLLLSNIYFVRISLDFWHLTHLTID